MKRFNKNALTMVIWGAATAAYAASGTENEGSGLLLWLFVGFGAMIIVFQLVPGAVLFVSMLKGLVSPRETPVSAGEKSDNPS